ncbi:fluoride efflux transporter CrcB [Kitasatospora sp. NBC_01287]|uniref:fluoride efflux transporter CrcB n=1 Tax=Kitasatospora sp. NBC_01287 TaxID=2903573 RepID=UPI0022582BB9|nr:fluoride efflux transporter CrcB [Kitasatospora sp. NBC_01287]MCX4749231.1 fluoride efflux transporter CrcB [Kitasatospora sp. NBC_01287]
MAVLMVFLGGMLGAPLRYLTDKAVQSRHDSVFPWGTFVINISGAFVLGALTGATHAHGLPSDAMLLLGTGLCGALTTFSTFTFETVHLLEDGSLAEAGVNAIGSLIAGIAAAAAGYALLTWL